MKHLKKFLSLWGEQFYDFMWGWGTEILRAVFYTSIGMGIVCAAYNIPPQTLQPNIPQILGTIVGVTLVINMIVSLWRLFNPDEDEKETRTESQTTVELEHVKSP